MNLKNAVSFLKKQSTFWSLGILTVIILVYWRWFMPGEILGGDLPYFYNEFLHAVKLPMTLWSTYRGIGGGVTPFLGLDTLQAFYIVLGTQILHLPWLLVYKVGWFLLFLVVSVISSYYFLKKVAFEHSKYATWLGVLMFTTNTYILMIVGGGQMWIALAYALTPFLFARAWSRASDISMKSGMGSIIVDGISIGLLLLLDLRIGYVVLLGILLLMLVKIARRDMHLSDLIPSGASLGIALAINAFWIIPMIFVGASVLTQFGSAYTSITALRFFSVADFSHTVSLLHPNWPENIFGKVYFLQPEFLVLPILSLAGLLFLKSSKEGGKSTVIAFALMGIMGSFLAKGSQEPFGNLYVWFFQHIPGFMMFRDPTKFYLLIVISWSILIPLTLEHLSDYLRTAPQKQIRIFSFLPYAIFFVFWMLTIHQAIEGTLGGTFARGSAPGEYREIEKFITRQPSFFRTLWVPEMTRLSFVSYLHPAIGATDLLHATNSAEFADRLTRSGTSEQLSALGIKYVFLSSDPAIVQYQHAGIYDPILREQYQEALNNAAYLTKISLGTVTIYELASPKDHIAFSNGEKVNYRMVNPAEYQVSFSPVLENILYFSEQYHPGWKLYVDNMVIRSQKTKDGLNSFSVPAGSHTGTIYFSYERYAQWGRWVTIGSVIFLVGFCMVQFGSRKKV